MYSEKLGAYIKELREKKKWSQEELAQKLYVTRQSVSSWEKGKNYPHLETLKSLSEIFNVNLIELFAGEKLKDAKKENEVVYLVIKNEKKKQKRTIVFFVVILFLSLFLFLSYYFFNTYSKTKIYRIGAIDSNTYLNGMMIKNREMSYFELIEQNLKIKTMSLYYKDKEIYKTDDNLIIFREKNGYNEYHSFEKDFIENLTLKIITQDEKQYEIELILDIDFENKNLLFLKEKEIGEEETETLPSETYIPEKIKREFTYKDENYELQIKEKDKAIDMSYFVDTKLFWVTEKNESLIKEWRYSLDDQFLFYSEKNVKNNYSYRFEENIFNLNNKKDKSISEYFEKYYKNKYLNE